MELGDRTAWRPADRAQWGMADDRTQRLRLKEVLRVTADALGAWMAGRLEVWPPDRRGNVHPHDPSYLFDTVLQHRADSFPEFHPPEHAGALYRLRESRNSWAHFD